jgi:hypothetical protein
LVIEYDEATNIYGSVNIFVAGRIVGVGVLLLGAWRMLFVGAEFMVSGRVGYLCGSPSGGDSRKEVFEVGA